MSRKGLVLFFVCVTFACVFSDELQVSDTCAKDEKCVDQKLQEIMEKIDNEDEIVFIDGIKIAKIPDTEPVNVARKADEQFLDRVQRYIRTHELKLDDDDEHSPRKYDEEGRTSKLKKFILPLLLVLKLKLALILPAILSALTLISIKGLFTGLVALLISSATALKTLGDGKHDRVTTILASPIPAEVRPHHDYRWARVGQEAAQDLPPQAMPPQGVAPQQLIDPYAAYSGYQAMTQLNPVQ